MGVRIKEMKDSKGVLLVGNYPPPISGQSISFKLCVEAVEEEKLKFEIINTIEKEEKTSFFFRSVDYVKAIFQIFYHGVNGKYSLLYSIISVSNKGLLRDYFITLSAKLFRLKLVLHSHNGCYNTFYDDSNWVFKKMIQFVTKSSDTIIILSDRLYPNFYFLKDSSKLKVLPNSLPFKLSEMNIEQEKSDSEKINVLFLSNLIEAKGYYEVLEAINLLIKKGEANRFSFHFAGSIKLHSIQDDKNTDFKTAKKRLDIYLKKLSLDASVTYHGVVYGEEKEKLLNEADIFILPTYYNIEAQPITLIEAIAFGCSILATEYRAIPEMLVDAKNGFFIKPKDPDDIVEKLLFYNKNMLLEHRNVSKELYYEKFKIEFFKRNYISLIKERL